MPLYDDYRQLEDLRRTAEAFRVATIESGALHKVPQDQTIDQLRALETALTKSNYLFDAGGIKDAADWCRRSLDQAVTTGCPFDTKPFVQNARLIIAALDRLAAPPLSAEATLTALESWSIVEQLRAPEGAEVMLFCDNPDMIGANNALEVCDHWTDWKYVRFEGETLLEALRAALKASKGDARG